ncbi:MAG TPA: SDR family oxidoreductase [Gammaproteobacteria bacterium]|nr:SDR family oxidoreductase [Gammaproteobacteria bacterium]
MRTAKNVAKKIPREARKQEKQPGLQYKMKPSPIALDPNYKSSDKLKGKVAIVTGGDSGIGQAVALLFAKEGADIVIPYLKEHHDAKNTQKAIEVMGRACMLIAGDLGKERVCQKIAKKAVKAFGQIDILINNAAEQHPTKDFEKITEKQLKHTFASNIFSYFYMIKAVLPHLREGSVIINTSSVTCYKGSDHLMDYAATKGGIVGLTRSLSNALIKKGIRVNGVAPGPVWTPLIVASFSKEHIKKFGKDVPMGRPAQPAEIAPCYLFLACKDSSYMSGQMLHPNGGVVVNG